MFDYEDENISLGLFEEKIQKINKEIENNKYPPSFIYSKENKTFFGLYGDKPHSNCFSYTLDVADAIWDNSINGTDVCSFTCLGRKGHVFNYLKISRKKVIRLLYESFDFFGIKLRSSNFDEKLKEGETKFILGLKEYDFHFIRQDEDENWSHIRALGELPERIDLAKINIMEYIEEIGYSFFGVFAYSK